MAISTLVIGIGGTGVLTLRALKQLYGSLPDRERVPASFLAFDFDRSALISGDRGERFSSLEEDEFFYLNPRNIQDLLRNIDRSLNGEIAWQKILEWFPDRSHVQIPSSEVEANGASQLRVLGRLGFFQNDELIEGALRRRLNELGTEIDQIRLSEDKRVILVSSTAGGTGAGMLVDLAYVARRQAVRPRVFTYLLLPEVFQDVDSGGRIFQNSYACLKELAYLKDQQIPFQADYYRIPPINIPTGGEEPFARIYLCRGEGFSGTDAIKEATVVMAQAILAQLQETLQEKTLSIVSNTLSADPLDQQKRRRTHCFSTSGSYFMELEPLRITREDLFRLVLRGLRDTSFLEEVFAPELKSVLDKVSAEARKEETSKDGQAQGLENVSAEEKWARDLEKLWLTSIKEQSKQAQSGISENLSQKLNMAREEVLKKSSGSLEKGLAGIKRLKEDIILVPFNEETYPTTLTALRDLAGFQAHDDSLQKAVETHLRSIEGSFGADDALRKRALYERLERLHRRPVDLSDASWPEREVLLKEWDARSSKLQKLGERRWPWFWRTASRTSDSLYKALEDCDVLEAAMKNPNFQERLAKILQVRARKALLERIRETLQSMEKAQEEGNRVWANLPIDERVESIYQLPEEFRPLVLAALREELPEIRTEARRLIRKEDDPETRQQKLMSLVQRRLEVKSRSWRTLFKLQPPAGSSGDWEPKDTIRDALVRCRQKVFERRTPNPQRKGFGLIMVPQGLYWPEGNRDDLRSFLESSAVQILGCRCQVEVYDGSRIWIYYEDLFNPPEHIRNLDEYYRTYSSQKYRELFHIDRRFLENPAFREINSGTATLSFTCGNPGCRENISAQPRTERLCRGCGRPILSRCGNDGCPENNLLSNLKNKDKQCPACGGFNHAAWWVCEKHGKVVIEIPIDKLRCPRCIEEHLNDPVAWPESKISVRPDLLDSVACPHCEDLQATNAAHDVFYIPKPLLRFYRDGVNGHDRKEFLRLAELYKLPDKCRCPYCRTLLIPIHHEPVLHQERRPRR